MVVSQNTFSSRWVSCRVLLISGFCSFGLLSSGHAAKRQLRPRVAVSSPTPSPSPVPNPPVIQSLVKPEIYERVMGDRQVHSYGSLDSIPGQSEKKRYSIYAIMLVRADRSMTRRVLTDYPIYAKMVPFVEKSEYNPETHLLDIRGSILKWVMESKIRFEDRSDRWVHFTVIDGSFTGLVGDMFFESKDPKGTLVYLQGEVQGTHFPPAFILERGAEMALEFTGKRMRTYIEDQKKPNR